MADLKTVEVPHLNGITAAYRLSPDFSPSKPTLILINSFMTSSELYTPQFDSAALTAKLNLLAIEPLGHGQTRTKSEHFTFWDTAIMNLQVMDALNIDRAFVLGTSQGGWVTVRMALLAPEKIRGIIPLGSSMDYESPRSTALGCWDGPAACSGPVNAFSTPSVPNPSDFAPDDAFCTFLISTGFGPVDASTAAFWTRSVKQNYAGDDGRRRARMASINLRDRDGLHGRVGDVTCPVLWMHGTEDSVYSVVNAEEEIRLFTASRDARLAVVQGGAHFLSASSPAEVESEVLDFVERFA